MEFMWIGSVNQYAKVLARQTQWKLKKQSGDFTGHKKSLQDYVSFTRASDLLPDADERDDRLSAIVTKAQAGKKLSRDEWEYLRVKAPEMYEKLREIEREQENYEKALKRCKTRDEARRLHVSKLGDIMTAAKNGDSSALFRLNRITQTMTAFTESEEYHKLPTEAEQAIERESERKAKQEALRQEAAVRRAEQEAASQSEAEDEAETEPVSEAEADTKFESVSEAEAADKAAARAEAGDAAYREDIRPAVPRAAEQTTVRQPEPPDGKPMAKGDAAPTVSFGQRAYLDQQRGESRGHSRRRAFDAEA